jgi:hypothetical protein
LYSNLPKKCIIYGEHFNERRGGVLDFWTSTLSSAIGSFVGILGAFFIAKWQINKGQKLENNPYYFQFNEAQIHINSFYENVKKILEITESADRRNARILLSEIHFLDLKKNLELTIKTLNKEIREVNFNNFIEQIMILNQNAPLAYYRDLNSLIIEMAWIYNLLIKECKNLVMDLPSEIDIPMGDSLSLNLILKRFRQNYKKMKKKLKV